MFPILLVLGIIAFAIFILWPTGYSNKQKQLDGWLNRRDNSSHKHIFLPTEWDDNLYGAPFQSWEGGPPHLIYAWKCNGCGEVRKGWNGPPGDPRDPGVFPYKGSWTIEKWENDIRDRVRADILASVRRGEIS